MWVKIDDKFHSNAKVYDVGNEGAGLYVRALSYCADHLTDGFVPRGWVQSIASNKLTAKLTAARLWRAVDGGYIIDAYLELNLSKAEHEARREAKREAGKKGAESRWRDDRSHNEGMADAIGAANAVASRSHVRRNAPAPVPVPVPVERPPASTLDVARVSTNGRRTRDEDFTRIGEEAAAAYAALEAGADDRGIPTDDGWLP